MIFLLLLTGASDIYLYATGVMRLMTCEWYTPKTFSMSIKHFNSFKSIYKNPKLLTNQRPPLGWLVLLISLGVFKLVFH